MSPLVLAEPDDVVPDLSGLNLVKQQIITTYPGYHLPHVWIAKDGQSEFHFGYLWAWRIHSHHWHRR